MIKSAFQQLDLFPNLLLQKGLTMIYYKIVSDTIKYWFQNEKVLHGCALFIP